MRMHRHEFRAMGSRMLGLVDSEELPPVLQHLPDQVEEWEQTLSRFRFDSELCILNRQASKPVVVSQVLWDVFEVAREAERITYGLVNPLVMEALIEAGYDRSFDLLQGTLPGHLSPNHATVSPLSGVTSDIAMHSICLPEGAQLDFGGVAKGWVANQAMLALSSAGPALFSAGGDIAISGPHANGEPWEITVDDPFRPGEHIEVIYLEGGGVATSGRDRRRWMRAGIPQHHIIDPRTGVPAETDVLTATVIAPSSLTAEVMAKAVLISGSKAGLDWLDRDDNLAGLLILEDGRLLYSQNMGDYL